MGNQTELERLRAALDSAEREARHERIVRAFVQRMLTAHTTPRQINMTASERTAAASFTSARLRTYGVR